MPYESIAPILRVNDMQRALSFYVGVLGFTNADWGTDDFTSVNSGNTGIYLCRGGQGRGGAWVWVGCGDARHLYRQLLDKGIAVRMEPTNFAWALEIQVEDPDGNVLRFGSEPE